MARETTTETNALFAENPLPMFVVLRSGLIVLASNRSAEKMYGVPGGLVGWPVSQFWPQAERPDLEMLLAEAAAARHRSGPWTHLDDTGNTHEVGLYCSFVDFQGAEALLLVIIDLTDDLGRERALIEGASRDSLTGAMNSARFLERLRMMVDRGAQDPEYDFVTLYIDIDDFRDVNERFGHIEADKILAEVGARLVATARPGELIGRVGGDEFSLLSDLDVGGSGPVKLAQRMLRVFDAPFGNSSTQVTLTASIGVVVGGGEESLRSDVIIRNASAAMHRAKQQGGGRYEIFDESVRSQAVEYARTEAELRRGLERGEFVLFYQPIVTLPGGEMHGAEALLRWNHPEEGLLAPDAFISVAEDSGLIVPLGDWVIREACRQLREWREAGLPELSVSVNVSARQFKDGDVCETLRSALCECGVDARFITAELTESLVMDDPAAAIETMTQLTEMGVGLAMDDFGTGYSSLSYLKRFRFDSLKIDRSFIEGIDSSAGDAALVAAVIALAHSFKSRAVGEGVETNEQLQYLRLLKCDMAQGYFFSRPIPAEDFGDLMRRGAPWLGLV